MIEAGQKLHKLTECCICLKEFTDPRMLPCTHTFCLGCLKQTGDATRKEFGETIPCPLCRKEFRIPTEGMTGLPKHFLIESLKDVTTLLPIGNKPAIGCDMCKTLHEGDEETTKEATARCLECRENFCDMCSKVHQLHKLSINHNIVKIENETEDVFKMKQSTKNCIVHNQQPFILYCIDCNQILCKSCFVEKHISHNSQDVSTMHKEFRKTIENSAKQISNCAGEILSNVNKLEQRKAEAILNFAQTEDKIQRRNLELKEILDNQTRCLIEELSLLKHGQLKNFANYKEEIDRICGSLKSFETYCNELITKESDGNVYNCVEYLVSRTNELQKDHKELIGRKIQITEVSLIDTQLKELLSHTSNNAVGEIKRKNYLFGVYDSTQMSDDSAPPAFIGSASLTLDKSTATKHEQDKRKTDRVVTIETAETEKGKMTNKIIVTQSGSRDEISSSSQSDSRERPPSGYIEGMDTESLEECGIVFHEALAKYKEMLEKIRNICMKLQTKDKKTSPLLKIEEAEKFRKQFDLIKRIASEKWETTEWNSIELHQERLIELTLTDPEGQRYAKILKQVEDIIKEILKKLDAVELLSRKGLINTSNNYYFNTVIQCLCQTFPFLEELRWGTFSGQPLTEAFVTLVDRGYLGPSEQKKACSKFLRQLNESSSKFSNFRLHDSYDFFVQFINDLRSEERLHIAQGPQLNVNLNNVLTAVDKVFGGHLVTVHACQNCNQPNYVYQCMLAITLSISIRKQQHHSAEDSRAAYQLTRQSACASTLYKWEDVRHFTYSDQAKQLRQIFLEALNEEQNIPEDKDRGSFTKPITLTECLRFYTTTEHIPKGHHCSSCQGGSSASEATTRRSMSPALKRTLIYDPPAILVLHLKRFELSASGTTKRPNKVTYEELLDLGPFCSPDCLRIDQEDKNIWYSLYGVVAHIGSLERGNYIAYVKIGKSTSKATETFLQKSVLEREEIAAKQKQRLASGGKRADRKVEWQPTPATGEKWICVSDIDTRDATLRDALNLQEPFMLFYKRVPKYGQ